MKASYLRPRIVLIVSAEEWVSLSIETLFAPRGYAVLRTHNAAQAMQRVGEIQPDLVVISRDLRETSGVRLCETLLEQGLTNRTTPKLVISTSPWTRDERIEALRAGFWDTCALPMDGEELFIRVDAWVQAKLEADVAREHSLLDPSTGLYNTQGLLRRIGELGAGAGRHNRALACLAISAEWDGAASAPRTATSSAAVTLAARLQETGRASDAIGRVGEKEFVVVAPDTDGTGVVGLARRLRHALQVAGEDSHLRFGYYAVPNFRDASIAPAEMLIRATEALHSSAQDQVFAAAGVIPISQ